MSGRSFCSILHYRVGRKRKSRIRREERERVNDIKDETGKTKKNDSGLFGNDLKKKKKPSFFFLASGVYVTSTPTCLCQVGINMNVKTYSSQ